MDKRILRVIDANINRSTEGLRVCEEVVRFLLGAPALTKQLKSVRHSVHKTLRYFPKQLIIDSRDVHSDAGRRSSFSERRRRDPADLFCANLERVKESLRVLEEFAKLIDKRRSMRFKTLRFKVYDIEKSAYKRLASLRHTR